MKNCLKKYFTLYLNQEDKKEKFKEKTCHLDYLDIKGKYFRNMTF